MKRPLLELDYVVLPRRPAWIGLLLLTVALGIAADLVLRYRNARDTLARAVATERVLETVRRAAPVPMERLDEQVKVAEAAVRQLTLPWATLIQVLEDATTKDVAVLQVQPEAQQRVLRITAEARNHKAMLQYQSNLAAAGVLADVHLLNHRMQLDNSQKPVQFSLQATFRAAP